MTKRWVTATDTAFANSGSSRGSTFRFKDMAVELPQLREELGATFVVEGSVRGAAGRVRISAQLIDAAAGVHLWADQYDREMEDIFALQDEVTRMIAATLGVKLQDIALQQSMRKSPAELDAYDCVLRARRDTELLSADSHAEARDFLEAAVKLDPTNADAHALLANIYLAEYRFDANPRPDPIGQALRMAQIATRLDPQNGYARSAGWRRSTSSGWKTTSSRPKQSGHWRLIRMTRKS